ncbi:MAG TPA: hypothetical protein VFC07_02665, partial [Verrucomicrobiae bacterium]|nr:hypothetical protein [Verrucomicrobiae bacterium]
WSDVLTHAPNLSPTVGREVYETDKIRQYHRENQDSKWDEQLKLGEARAMRPTMPKSMYRAMDAADVEVYGRRLALFLNYNLIDHVPKSDGFFSLNLREMERLTWQLMPATTNNDLPALKDFMSVSHIINPTNPVAWIARDTFLPLITAGQKPIFMPDDAALREVMGPAFAPAKFVCLPPQESAFIKAADAVPAKILSRHFEAQRIEAEVESPAPTMLVVAQSFYHLWRPYVDGKPTRLCRANYAFQALEVPAGKHQVTLIYEDRNLFYGAILSLISLLGCAAIWFRSRSATKAFGAVAR